MQQFEFEVLALRVGADAEGELIVRRQIARHHLPGDGIAAVAVKVEVEPVRVRLRG